MPKVGYCVQCNASTHVTDVLACDHRIFTALDKIEQAQVTKALQERPFNPVLYRGFEIVTNRFDGYEDYEASRDNHEWSFVAPNLPALLHIIWLITKDEP